MANQGYKGTKGNQRKSTGNKKGKIYRTEWRVTSQNRAPRVEVFDMIFSDSQVIHKELGRKCQFALEQLQNNVLRFGESAELSKVYFVGKS